MITLERLLRAIRKKPFVVHTCSMCGYKINYHWSEKGLCRDNGCWCVSYTAITQVSNGDLDFYINAKAWQPRLKNFVEEAESGSHYEGDFGREE